MVQHGRNILTREKVEKERENENDQESTSPDYSLLHNTAQHVMHVSETLTMGVATVESVLKQHERFCHIEH